MANTIRRPEDYGTLGDGKSDDLEVFTKMLAAAQPNDMIQLSSKFQSLDGTVTNAELAIAQDYTAKQSAGGRRDSFFSNTYLSCYPNNNMAL